MRNIKFRGLRKEYNPDYHQDKWYYGNLLNGCSIGEVGIGLDSYTYAEVIPETVGEFTGLKDKNGKEIYEGDVLKWIGTNVNVYDEVFYNQVYWLVYRWRIKGTKNGKTWHSDFNQDQCFNHNVEIIGNIHENPELLK